MSDDKPGPVNTKEQALARAEQVAVTLAPSGTVQLTSLDEALRFSKWAVDSGLLPNGIKTVAQAFVIMQKGAELGFSPMASFEFIYPVNGRGSRRPGRWQRRSRPGSWPTTTSERRARARRSGPW
jgi:hypothetical protein